MQLRIADNHPVSLILPEIKIINNLEELAGYKEEWNKILKDNDNTNPFLEFDWIENWWNYFGTGYSLFVLVLQLEERIVGFCPFMILKRKFYKEITFIGHPEASYMEFILTREGRDHGIKPALDYLKKLNGKYILHLNGLYEESDTYQILEDYFKKNQYNYFIRCFEDPYIIINNDFVSYLKERSKHRTVKTLIRNKSKLEGLGDVSYRKLNSSEFDEIFQLHDMRWKRKYDTSNFSEKKHQEFYRAIANDTNLSFQVWVNGFMLGTRLIAFAYGIQCNGTYYFYRISHDNDFSVFSPGKIILMKLLEDCFQNEIQVFDFGLGYAKYKYEWTDDKKTIHELVAPFASGFSRIFYYKYLIRKIIIQNLKKIKFYNTFKVGLLGMIHCLITGVYYRDMIHALKKEVVKSKIRASLKKTVKNLYSHKEYLIYEKSFDNPCDDTMLKDIFGASTSQEVLKSLLDIELDCKTDNIIIEACLNDLEFLCELMKEQPAQIIKRFYQKQRCFIMDDGSNLKKCLWINYNNIEIPDINYQDKLLKYESYIDLTKIEVGEDSIKSFLKAINCIINILDDEKCTRCYIGFNYKKEFPKDLMTSIGFKPANHIKYKKLLFRSYLKIKKGSCG